MKPSEIRDKNETELVELEQRLREQLVKMRVARAASRNVASSAFRGLRRDIARIQTIRNQRVLGLTSE